MAGIKGPQNAAFETVATPTEGVPEPKLFSFSSYGRRKGSGIISLLLLP